MKRFLPKILLSFLFFILTVSFQLLRVTPVSAQNSCVTGNTNCTALNCSSPCIKTVTQQGGPGGHGAAVVAQCACQMPAAQQAGPGEQCQGDENNNNCSSAAPYCWSSTGQPPICRTQTHSQALQQNQTGNNGGPIPGIHFPCNKTADPEFASLRPYQAAACGDADKALYCSNDLIFTEDFKIPGGQCKSQAPAGEGSFVCTLPNPLDVPDHILTVYLANSSLPILGNTELTKNSQLDTNADQIDDATKVNEYASWYLNGVDNRAEYGSEKNTDNETVNYSGPIQKIMPQAILEAQRISVINSTSTNVSPDAEDKEAPSGTQPANHNQIIVCAKRKYSIPLVNLVTNFLHLPSVGFGNMEPVDCYPSKNSTAQETVYRLSDVDDSSGNNWHGTDLMQDMINWFANNLASLFPSNVVTQVLAGAASRWSLKIPPLPWADQNGKPFPDEMSYQKAYNEWRGRLCAILPNPITGGKSLVCIGAWPWINNPYADLFPYIPLANTVDKHGSETDYIAEIKPSPPTEIENPSYDIPQSAPLWFAHAQEVKDLSAFLNTSYTPKGVENIPVPQSTETNNCSVVNVRANPGDNLFPGQPHGVVVGGVHYTITKVPCEKTIVTQTIGKPPNETVVTKVSITCNAEVIITLPTVTKSPWLDNIWQTTVADSGSTFRRIYPKVETGAPVSCIADIPGKTGVDYHGTDTVDVGGTGVFSYKNPAEGSNNASELYFPHLGSVYDYFLKGIQTALRPQGYADPTPISGKYCLPTIPKDCLAANVNESSVPAKYLGAFKAKFIDLADRWTADCPGGEYNQAAECYNYVVSEAQKAGVNPAFALSIWLHESDASNYCHGGPTTQDFGINLSSLYQNIAGQLAVFLNMAKTPLCQGVAGFPEPMAGWLSRYKSQSGSCDPTDADAMSYYPEIRDTAWGPLTNCPKGTKFGITWPTDMSCP